KFYQPRMQVVEQPRKGSLITCFYLPRPAGDLLLFRGSHRSIYSSLYILYTRENTTMTIIIHPARPQNWRAGVKMLFKPVKQPAGPFTVIKFINGFFTRNN